MWHVYLEDKNWQNCQALGLAHPSPQPSKGITSFATNTSLTWRATIRYLFNIHFLQKHHLQFCIALHCYLIHNHSLTLASGAFAGTLPPSQAFRYSTNAASLAWGKRKLRLCKEMSKHFVGKYKYDFNVQAPCRRVPTQCSRQLQRHLWPSRQLHWWLFHRFICGKDWESLKLTIKWCK